MTTTAMKNQGAKKHDWLLFTCGLLVAVMGVLILGWPGLSMITLAIMAGAILFAAGISDIYVYAKMRGVTEGSGWVLATGICDLLLGALFVIYPIATAAMLPWIAGIFVLFYSSFAIFASIASRNALPGWGFMLATGIIGVLCGIMFIVSPATFPIFLGIFLIMRGVTMSITGIVAPNSFFYL